MQMQEDDKKKLVILVVLSHLLVFFAGAFFLGQFLYQTSPSSEGSTYCTPIKEAYYVDALPITHLNELEYNGKSFSNEDGSVYVWLSSETKFVNGIFPHEGETYDLEFTYDLIGVACEGSTPFFYFKSVEIQLQLHGKGDDYAFNDNYFLH